MTRQHPSMAMVFRTPRLLPWKTVRENIVLALLHGQQPLDKQSAVDEALALVRLHGLHQIFIRMSCPGGWPNVSGWRGHLLCDRIFFC